MSDPSARFRLRVGIDPCANPEPSVEEMRAAIWQGALHSALIHTCGVVAELRGLTAEERYVMLAYRSLIALESYAQRVTELLERMPPAAVYIKDSFP